MLELGRYGFEKYPTSITAGSKLRHTIAARGWERWRMRSSTATQRPGRSGLGLGRLTALMDELVIASSPDGGTHVTSRMWLRRSGSTQNAMQLSFGAATRPHPQMAGVNGDAFVICRRDELALVGVIDGVGHGQFAQRAAQTARREVEVHVNRPLDDIFRSVGRACRATRGVGMALARFNCSKSTVELASVGNIELRTRGDAAPVRYLVRRGILGLNAPSAAVTEQPWNQEAMMVMYSDGIRSHWGWEESPDIDSLPVTEVAGTLLRKYAREDDDATVLVVKGLC